MKTLARFMLAALMALVCTPSFVSRANAVAGTNLTPLVLGQCLDSSGDPVSGCRAYSYLAGTSTSEPLYSDQARTSSHGAYVAADSAGYFPSAYCAVDTPLKIVYKTSADVTIRTYDNVDCPLGASQVSLSLTALGLDGTAAAATIGTSGDVIVKANTANTWSGQQTFTAGTIHSSTTADATAGPEVQTYRNSATPASDDLLGILTFYGEDSADNKELYSACKGEIIDPSSGSEYGAIICDAILNASNTNVIRIGALDSSDTSITGFDLLTGEYYQTISSTRYQVTGKRYVETLTASSSTSLDAETIPTGCDVLHLTLLDIVVETDDVQIYITTKVGGTYQSTNYSYARLTHKTNSNTGNSASASQIITTDTDAGDGVGSTAGESLSGTVRVYNPLGTSVYKHIEWEFSYIESAGDAKKAQGTGSYLGGTGALQGVRLAPESDTFVSGTIISECEFLP